MTEEKNLTDNDKPIKLSEDDKIRFFKCVVKTDTCWNWVCGLTRGGYGQFRIGDKKFRSPRISYLIYYGKLDNQLQIDHLCKNRLCVNPKHLELVTQKENILRGDSFSAKKARQTHCIHGHILLGDNLYLWKNQRKCRRCRETTQMKRRDKIVC